MRAKELVPILAELFSVPFDTAFVIDRTLAESGLRAKGKGRAWPEMTRREALHFLIACMSAMTIPATKVADEVGQWVTASTTLRVKYIQTSAEDDGELEPFGTSRRKRKLQKTKVDRSNLLPFLKDHHDQTVTLIDYLLMVTSYLNGQHVVSGNDITLTLSPTHREAKIKIHLGFGRYEQETFWTNGGPDLDELAIRTDISVTGEFLAAIAARTADPLAEAIE
jgi:hypothetical protein